MRITRRSLVGGAAALAFGTSKASAQQSAQVLRMAHSHPEHDPVHKTALRMAELVKERTGGAVDIKVYANGLLGSDPATAVLNG